MRKRSVGINVRVSVTEKKKVTIQTIIFLDRKAALKRGIIHQLRVFSESHHIHSPFIDCVTN